MKSLLVSFIVLLVAIVDFTGCRNKDNNPIDPIDSTTTGRSVISGRVILPDDRIDSRSSHIDSGNFKGVKVQVLNSALQAETDEKGFWKIQNLDSGTYTIQFTKQGYDTVIIRGINLKNKDSIYIGTPQNRVIVQWADVVLNEQITGQIVSSSAQIVATVVKEYKDPKDTSKVVYREYQYDFLATMGITLRGLTVKDWSQTPYDICYTITNSPSIDLSSYPQIGPNLRGPLSNNNNWYFVNYWSETSKISKTGVYTVSLMDDEDISRVASIRGFDLNKREQLYLHILPVWHQWARVDYAVQDHEYWKRGEVVSIPIKWK